MNFIVQGGYSGLNLIRKCWESEKGNGQKDTMEDIKSVTRVVETLGNLQSSLDCVLCHSGMRKKSPTKGDGRIGASRPVCLDSDLDFQI